MRKIFYILLFIFNINNSFAIESKIIYEIENELITNIDIKNEFKYLSALNNQLQNLEKEKIFNIAKTSIIREKIKKIEILKNFKSLNIEKKYLELRIENTYSKLGLNSYEEFKDSLINYNLDMKNIEEKIQIEALWNQLILNKYLSKISIDIDQIKKEINKTKSITTKNYLLSEIIFEIENKDELDKKYTLIKKSIDDIGFKNTVSTYSISDTSKTGGNLGWVNENSLNKIIKKNILLLKEGEISKPLLIPGGVLVLKINDIKSENTKLDPEIELKKIINFQRNKQLNQYSKIYFNKIKKNLELNE